MGERGLKVIVLTVRLEVWSGGGVRRFNGGEGVKGHSSHCQIRSMEWGGG